MAIKDRFSIKDLEILSGIKAHTIRIWEQRYGILRPKRSETNIRHYSTSDLKTLMNISTLNNNGIRISRIAELSQAEIAQKVKDLQEVQTGFPDFLNGLVISMVDLDEYRFENLISRASIQLGFSEMMEKVIYPFLQKVGVMWVTNAIHPAHEHFISNLIRQKIIVAIDGQTFQAGEESEKYILFLPEGELHEISLLFLCYYLRSRKKKVIYLGMSVPLEDLISIGQTTGAEFLLTVLTSSLGVEELKNYIRNLSRVFKKSTLLVAGAQVLNLNFKFPSNVVVIRHISQLDELLQGNKEIKKPADRLAT